MKPDRSTLKMLLVALGALAYTASPIDLIPELLAGPFGFGDDAVALVAAGITIYRIMRSRRLRQRPATGF